MRTIARSTLLLSVSVLLSSFTAAQVNAPARWQQVDLIQPAALAVRILDPKSKPVIFQVGFLELYRANHIPGALFAGPGSSTAGLEALKRAVANIPKDREIVIYCACCPWTACPNVRPAFDLLRNMGYTRVKALMVATNLQEEWVDKHYPMETGVTGK